MLLEQLKNYRIILASGSPRRQQLLKELGLNFEARVPDVDEVYPEGLKHSEIAVYLSQLKANSFDAEDLCGNCLVIAADTIVWMDGKVLPKPKDAEEASSILNQLSGKVHGVITGVTLRNSSSSSSFFSKTRVYFKELTGEEIRYYIDVYKPFDKAGAYGIQEWIGYIGIEKIEGSYYNVMGLPVQMLYQKILEFIR